MSVEVVSLISLISMVAGIFFGLIGFRRTQKSADREEASKEARMLIEIKTIANGVVEIRSDVKEVKEELKENRERLIRVEESAKQAHKRIDTLEGVNE